MRMKLTASLLASAIALGIMLMASGTSTQAETSYDWASLKAGWCELCKSGGDTKCSTENGANGISIHDACSKEGDKLKNCDGKETGLVPKESKTWSDISTSPALVNCDYAPQSFYCTEVAKGRFEWVENHVPCGKKNYCKSTNQDPTSSSCKDKKEEE